MKIWDRMSLAISTFMRGSSEPEIVAANQAAGDMANRWSKAFTAEPELAYDLIRLGGVLVVDPPETDSTTGLVAPRDPLREFEAKGKRDLALRLLAAGQMNFTEINTLMEASE